MPHLFFAQSVGEYGTASGAGSGLARLWTDLVLALRDIDDTTWIGIAVVAVAVVLWWLSRR